MPDILSSKKANVVLIIMAALFLMLSQIEHANISFISYMSFYICYSIFVCNVATKFFPTLASWICAIVCINLLIWPFVFVPNTITAMVAFVIFWMLTIIHILFYIAVAYEITCSWVTKKMTHI
jgi:hypothetical protein